MLDLNDFANKVHTNAKGHGWWDEPRTFPEICALIHSEWSEALEAYRNHEPMVWIDNEKGNKPDGTAVELIDGCIRIMDWMGYVGYKIIPANIPDGFYQLTERRRARLDAESVPELIARLHMHTTEAYMCTMAQPENISEEGDCLMVAMITAFYWLNKRGINVEEVLREKHEFNKSRPYRHGGKAL